MTDTIVYVTSSIISAIVTKTSIAPFERIKMLKQAQNAPIPVEEQVCVIYTGINGYLDKIDVTKVRNFLTEFRNILKEHHSDLLSTIQSEKQLSSESEESLKKILMDTLARWSDLTQVG